MAVSNRISQEFMTRRRVLEAGAQGILLVTLPTISFAQDSRQTPGARIEVHREVSPDSMSIKAWYQKGSDRVQFAISAHNTSEGHVSEMLFSKGNSTLLKVTAEVQRDHGSAALGLARLTATGVGVDYGYVIDARKVTLDRPRGIPAGQGDMRVTNKGQVWNGKFDYARMKPIGVESAPHLHQVIPSETQALIDPFGATLQYSVAISKGELHKYGVEYPESGGGVLTTLDPKHELCMAACMEVVDAAVDSCRTFAPGWWKIGCLAVWLAGLIACMRTCKDVHA